MYAKVVAKSLLPRFLCTQCSEKTTDFTVIHDIYKIPAQP